jgi:hypothetical protein
MSWRTLTKRPAGEDCLRALTNAQKERTPTPRFVRYGNQYKQSSSDSSPSKRLTGKVPQFNLQHCQKWFRFTPGSLRILIGIDPWTGAASTAAKPNSAGAVAQNIGTGGSDGFYGNPVSELDYVSFTKIDILDELYVYDITFGLERFHRFTQLPLGLPEFIGSLSCMYMVAEYIAKPQGGLLTGTDYRYNYNGGLNKTGDYTDFVPENFSGTTDMIEDLKGLGIFADKASYSSAGEMSIIRGASPINHAVSPVGWRGNNIVFYDPGYNGYRYMPYSKFQELHQITYFNLIPK